MRTTIETIYNVGQLPINACYYLVAKRKGKSIVALLDHRLQEIGEYLLDNQTVLNSLVGVTKNSSSNEYRIVSKQY
jgi:hypothetical protein